MVSRRSSGVGVDSSPSKTAVGGGMGGWWEVLARGDSGVGMSAVSGFRPVTLCCNPRGESTYDRFGVWDMGGVAGPSAWCLGGVGSSGRRSGQWVMSCGLGLANNGGRCECTVLVTKVINI